MAFQHTAEGRSLLLSQLPCVSHITLPQTWHKLYCNGLKLTFLLWLFDYDPFLSVYRPQHILETAALELPHTKSLSMPVKYLLNCNLSLGPLASPKVQSTEGRVDKAELGTGMQVLS